MGQGLATLSLPPTPSIQLPTLAHRPTMPEEIKREREWSHRCPACLCPWGSSTHTGTGCLRGYRCPALFSLGNAPQMPCLQSLLPSWARAEGTQGAEYCLEMKRD